jgi:DNA repair ATPase RecN
MKIENLRVKDLMIIEEMEIKPDKNATIFLGKNKSGKTSILKAIEMGLTGNKDTTVIRDGADKALVRINMDDGHEISWSLTKKGSERHKVVTPNGDIKPSVKKFLKQIVPTFSFDPIGFVLMDAKERKAHLLELFKAEVTKEQLLAGGVSEDVINRLDLSQDGLTVLKQAYDIFYDRRTQVNKKMKEERVLIEKEQAELEDFDGKDYKSVTEDLETEIDGIKTRLADAQALEKVQKRNQELIDGHQANIDDAVSTVKELIVPTDDEIEKKRARIQEIIEQINALNSEQKALTDEINAAHAAKEKRHNLNTMIKKEAESIKALTLPQVPNIKEILAELDAKHKEQQEAIKEDGLYEKWNALETKLSTHGEITREAKELTDILDTLKKDLPNEITKDVDLPIKDLTFDGDTVFIGDRNMDHMSTSEQVNIALTIVRTINKNAELKLICIDRAESLDDETLKAFREQIQDDEFTYFITQVYHNGQPIPEGAVVIEDGKVADAEALK